MAKFQGKPLTDVMGEIEAGRFLDEATEASYNIIAAVMDTRKVGTLKIELTFTPTGKGTVNVDAALKIKLPEHDRPSTTFFVGKDYSLLRRDPSQPDLPLREVERPDNEPIKVNA